ncbi:MAG: putative lipoprotein, partial [Myxococcaceae bacterium]|nr:putative lipoprotein [Myxococcaceae bacterium]
MKIAIYGSLAILMTAALSCSDSSGELRVLLAAEETISHGLQAGTGEENTKDYGVSYSKFLVVIGAVKLGRSDPRRARSSDAAFIADMRQVGEEGQEIVSFDSLLPGQWNLFGYQTPVALASSRYEVLPGVDGADAREMVDKQLTYWIEGTVERPGKPVSFVFKVAVPTTYSDCETNGKPGVSVGEGGASTATITLHGDHLWFDSLVRGDESTVSRRTQWLVDADVDGDGKVVTEDLAKVPAEVVFPSSQGYNLSGGPIPVATALDFVRGQLATQGHLDGEGECETLL